MKLLEGKNVLITGATGAVGTAVTRGALGAGAKVAAVGRRKPPSEALARGLEAASDRLVPIEGDVTDAESVASIVDRARRELSSIDGLLLVAGGYRGGSIPETPPDDWDFLFDLNVKGIYLMVRAVLPEMIARGSGSIVAVGAMSGLQGRAGAAAYAASKAAVKNFIEGVALEGKEAGVRANLVMPSTVDTAANREAMPDADFDKWVSPEEVAATMLYLASDESNGVTGASVAVPGRV